MVREYEHEFRFTLDEKKIYRPNRFNNRLRETNLYPTIREKLTKEWEKFTKKPINSLTEQNIKFLHDYIDKFGWFSTKEEEEKYRHLLRDNEELANL